MLQAYWLQRWKNNKEKKSILFSCLYPWKIWLRKINTIVFDWNRIGGNYGKVAIYFHIGSCSIIIMTQNYDCCHENSYHNTNTDTNNDLFLPFTLAQDFGVNTLHQSLCDFFRLTKLRTQLIIRAIKLRECTVGKLLQKQSFLSARTV